MNAYQTLGLKSGASQAEIKRVYRKLAQKYHPDKNKEAGSEAKFVLIKEAYEFLISGKSNSGVFDELKPTPKPKPPPKPAEPAPVWQTGYGAKNAVKVKIVVSFSDAYTGTYAKLPVPGAYSIHVRPGVQNGHKERRLCQSAHLGIQDYFDIEYSLYDPIGFYKLQAIDGVMRFCCHLEMTTGQVLSGFQHSLKNVNPNAGPVLVTIPANDYEKPVRIPGAGIRLDEAGRRSDLYVIPIVRFTPIEKEIQPVLVALNRKVQDALKLYNYFK